MYKLVVFTALLAVAAAAPGFLSAPIAAAPWGHGVVSAPLVSTGVVKTAVPVATSYANTVRIASPAAVVAAPAPIVAAHAPIVAAHAPVVAAPAYAHGW
ncbi:larval/pupal cuticle protein H1C [Manduca sexta]|uniref:Uncharacterized protein n=1 Tax=Manduca sexta TaxID=7130 RepID=A0A921YND0_MANSE|nr:larval/pupal cuticle protein H1C [Manduca sexta]KAG6442272.1 hypothetical protein O3G_MSEX002175 [Manduca sexta]